MRRGLSGLGTADPGVLARLQRLLARGGGGAAWVRLRCLACGIELVGEGESMTSAPAPAVRVVDGSAAAITRVLPRVPVRHWVLSLPRHLRERLAASPPAVRAVARGFVDTVFDWQRKVGRDRLRLVGRLRCGAVAVVQRGGAALNLDIHVHVLALDGVYVIVAREEPAFHPLPDPTQADLGWIAARVRRLVETLVPAERRADAETSRRGSSSAAPGDTLAAMQHASVHHRIATGPRAGRSVSRTVAADPVASPSPVPPRGATHDHRGWSVHAAWRVAADQRRAVARLAGYITRPPLDPAALEWTDDGSLRYRLKQPFADGTTHVEFSPAELVEKLVALLPEGPARRLTYHGVLAAAAAERERIVPGQLSLWKPAPRDATAPAKPRVQRRRGSVLCPQCGQTMQIVEIEHASEWLLGG